MRRGLMLPLVASPQSEQSVAAPPSKSRMQKQMASCDSALPDEDDPGLAKRVRRPTMFYGESSSDSEANSGSSDGSDSSGSSFLAPASSIAILQREPDSSARQRYILYRLVVVGKVEDHK